MWAGFKRSGIIVLLCLLPMLILGVTRYSSQEEILRLQLPDPDQYEGRTCDSRAIGCPRPEHRQEYDIQYLVIHATASSDTNSALQEFWFNSEKSTHYVITNQAGEITLNNRTIRYEEGQIIQMVSDRNTSWALGIWPINSIGDHRGPVHHFNSINIELVGNPNKVDWVTPRMYEALAKLIRELALVHKIDLVALNPNTKSGRQYLLGHDDAGMLAKPRYIKGDPCGEKDKIPRGVNCTFDWNLLMQLVQNSPSTLRQHPLSVSITEDITEAACRARVDPAAETAVKQKLIAHGFSVVSTGASISITGEGFGECVGRFDSFWQARARLEVKAAETATGRILFSEALHAGGIDVTPQAAAKRALQRAGERMGECLVQKLRQGSAVPCESQAKAIGVNDFEASVWTDSWNARRGMKEMVEKSLKDRGVQVVLPVAADIIVSGKITDYRVIYSLNIWIIRIGAVYMTVEPQLFNLQDAQIERGDPITDFAGGIQILWFRFGFGPEAVAKKISDQIATWVEFRVK